MHQFVWNEKLGAPAAYSGMGFFFAALYRNGMPGSPVPFIMKRDPAIEFSVLIINADRQFKIEWRKLVFQIGRSFFVRLQKDFHHIFIPEIQKIRLHGSGEYAVLAGIKKIKTGRRI